MKTAMAVCGHEVTDSFDRVWNDLAEAGKCDSISGMEYKRVRQEWIDEGRPEDIAEFISWRANIDADGKHKGFPGRTLKGSGDRR